jgi:hypothetical protein
MFGCKVVYLLVPGEEVVVSDKTERFKSEVDLICFCVKGF